MNKCYCAGPVRDCWHRWRRLDGSQSVGHITLYCLGCRQSWISKAAYAVLPPVHKPRSRIGMTDSEIMDMVKQGELVVGVNTAIVTKNGKELTKIIREHIDGPQKGTYRFVTVCKNGRKKKISVHRLVWMAENMRLVPNNYDVDHAYSQEDDTIDNLRLLPSSKNRRLGAMKAAANRESEF